MLQDVSNEIDHLIRGFRLRCTEGSRKHSNAEKEDMKFRRHETGTQNAHDQPPHNRVVPPAFQYGSSVSTMLRHSAAISSSRGDTSPTNPAIDPESHSPTLQEDS